MRRDISPEQVVEALLRESTFAFKEKGNYLRGLCPQCGKPELLVRKSMPWQVMCSGKSTAGIVSLSGTSARSLFGLRPALSANGEGTLCNRGRLSGARPRF